jgi:hypothetical protein
LLTLYCMVAGKTLLGERKVQVWRPGNGSVEPRPGDVPTNRE